MQQALHFCFHFCLHSIYITTGASQVLANWHCFKAKYNGYPGGIKVRTASGAPGTQLGAVLKSCHLRYTESNYIGHVYEMCVYKSSINGVPTTSKGPSIHMWGVMVSQPQ